MTSAVLLVVTAGAERSLRGSFTIIFAINGTLMGLLRDQPGLIRRAVASGLACDLLLKRPNASFARPRALRHFAFAVPASCTWLYFLTLILHRGVWWSLHLWGGAIVLAGVVVWLLSSLLLPPHGPEAEGAGQPSHARRGHLRSDRGSHGVNALQDHQATDAVITSVRSEGGTACGS
jgi:hypothetical protein